MKPVRLFAVRWRELAVIAIFGVGFAGCAARSVTTAGEASSIAVVTQEGGSRASVIPVPTGPAPGFEVPTPHVFTLANGVDVWLLHFADTPLISLSFIFEGGARVDPAGKEGLAYIAGDLLDEGTGELDALQLADEINFLGAQLSVGSDRGSTVLSLQVLARNFEPTLDIAARCLLQPRLAADDFVRIKELWGNGLKQRRDVASVVARLVADRAFFGDQHSYGHPVSGYASSAATIELEDVKEYYAQYLRPERLTILVASSLPEREVRPLLARRLGGWSVAEPTLKAVPPAQAPKGGARLIVVDKPDAPQTVVRMLVPGPAVIDPDSAPLIVANGVFGGVFTSRLSVNLRVRNGFTYGAGSRFAAEKDFGYVFVAADVFTENTQSALVEFAREFLSLQSAGMTQDEMEKARASSRTQVIQGLETQSGALSLFQRALAQGQGPRRGRELFESIAETTSDAVLESARRYLRWDQATIVLVGDRSKIDVTLQALRAQPPTDLPGAFVLPMPEYRDRDGQRIE